MENEALPEFGTSAIKVESLQSMEIMPCVNMLLYFDLMRNFFRDIVVSFAICDHDACSTLNALLSMMYHLQMLIYLAVESHHCFLPI